MLTIFAGVVNFIIVPVVACSVFCTVNAPVEFVGCSGNTSLSCTGVIGFGRTIGAANGVFSAPVVCSMGTSGFFIPTNTPVGTAVFTTGTGAVDSYEAG